MRCFRVSILSAVFGFMLTLPIPATATTKDQAVKMCQNRGKQCVSFGLGTDPDDDILMCVDNRSSGQGVQCVRCQGDDPCSVLREVPGDTGPDLDEVGGVLTESMQPADTRALEERIRVLEGRLKALEQARK